MQVSEKSPKAEHQSSKEGVIVLYVRVGRGKHFSYYLRSVTQFIFFIDEIFP